VPFLCFGEGDVDQLLCARGEREADARVAVAAFSGLVRVTVGIGGLRRGMLLALRCMIVSVGIMLVIFLWLLSSGFLIVRTCVTVRLRLGLFRWRVV